MFETETREAMEGKKLNIIRSIKATSLILVITSSILFFVGIVAAYYFGLNESFLGTGNLILDFTAITIAVFFLSVFFNGYLSPLVFLGLGIKLSSLILDNNFLLMFLVPLAFASYAGLSSAMAVKEAVSGKLDFFPLKKKIFIRYAVAIILSLFVGAVIPFIGEIKIL